MIFPWLWRLMPGGKILKSSTLLILLAGVVAILFQFVFPGLENFLTPPPVVDSLGISNLESKSHLPFSADSNVSAAYTPGR
mgnify:CR=1 FL=1